MYDLSRYFAVKMPAGNSVEEMHIHEEEKPEPCICVQENVS